MPLLRDEDAALAAAQRARHDRQLVVIVLDAPAAPRRRKDELLVADDLKDGVGVWEKTSSLISVSSRIAEMAKQSATHGCVALRILALVSIGSERSAATEATICLSVCVVARRSAMDTGPPTHTPLVATSPPSIGAARFRRYD